MPAVEAPPRKPRVIDIDALIRKQNEPSSAASVLPSSSSSACVDGVAEAKAPAPAPPPTYVYGGSSSSCSVPPAAKPLTEDEKERLARRRAEMALEQQEKEEKARADKLKAAAEEMVRRCMPTEEEDEEEVLRRFEALHNKLNRVQEIFVGRLEGNEDSYRTWASAEQYKRDEMERLADIERQRQEAVAAELRAEEKWRGYLRSLIDGIVDNIDGYGHAREARRVAALDKALQDEAADRIRLRDAREEEARRKRELLEQQLFTSSDPMVEQIRRERAERLEAFKTREAVDEADEEAMLEAKLARLSSLRRR